MATRSSRSMGGGTTKTSSSSSTKSSYSGTPLTTAQKNSGVRIVRSGGSYSAPTEPNYDGSKTITPTPTLQSLKDQLLTAQAALNGIKSTSQVGTGATTTQFPNVPAPTGNIVPADASVAGMQAMVEAEKQRKLDAQAQQEKADAKLQKSWLKDLVSPSQARADAQAQTGIDPQQYFADQQAGIDEIGKLTEGYNAIVAARDAQIAQTQDKLGSMNFINNQTAQIERNAAPKLNEASANINAKAAVLQAKQGNFAEAQNFVNQAVQDATADTKYKLDMFKTYYDINKDNFDRLDKIYSDSYTTALGIAEKEHDQAVSDKKLVGDLMLAYTNAGINMQDTPDSARQKVVAVGGSVEDLLRVQKLRQDLSGTTKNDMVTDPKKLQEWTDFTGVPIPFGVSESQLENTLGGWTTQDKKKYENNTDGFADYINSQFGITAEQKASGGFMNTAASWVGSGVKTVLDAFGRPTVSPQQQYSSLPPNLMEGYEPFTLDTITGYLGKK